MSFCFNSDSKTEKTTFEIAFDNWNQFLSFQSVKFTQWLFYTFYRMLLFQVILLIQSQTVWNQILSKDIKPARRCSAISNTQGEKWMVKHGQHDDILCEPDAVYYQEQ